MSVAHSRLSGVTRRSESAGRLSRPTDHALVLTAVLCLVDGLMTLPHWQLEGNPVVLHLGPLGMLAVKAIAVGGLGLTWFYSVRGSRYNRFAAALVWGLAALYGIVVATNVLVLIAVA